MLPAWALSPSIGLTNIWNSFSMLHFSFNESTQNLKNFLPLVDDSLSSLRSPEGNPIIHSFVLNLHLVRERRPFDIKRMLYLSKIISMVGSVWFWKIVSSISDFVFQRQHTTCLRILFLRNPFSHWIFRVALSGENYYFLVIIHNLIVLKS